jgi:deazaflavin-dependent oxidoreductase (nitroreductase family)
MTLVRRLLRLSAGVVLATVALAVFERVVPRHVRRAYQKHVGARVFGGWAGIVPGWALIETTGRRSGLTRRVPVGGRLAGDTYWLVAGDRSADFVRNIAAEPNVRLRVHGRWREGSAQLCPDDNPYRRLLRLNLANSAFIVIAGTDLLTIRIDLER